LAAGSATPGGGAAAAYAAAMAAGLVAMVARLTLGKKKYAGVEAQMQSLLDSAEKLRADLGACIADDSAAFEAVLDAFRLPKDTPEQLAARAQAVESAYHHAAEVPLKVARAAAAASGLALQAVVQGNRNAISDGGSAAYLARAGFAGAALNVRANAGAVQDQSAAAAWLQEIAGLESRIDETMETVEKVLKERK